MTMKMKTGISEALDLYLALELLICENCGNELSIPPEASNEIVCSECNTVMHKSHFSPFTRKQKLWVSEKGLKLCIEQHTKPLHFSCVKHYRSVVRSRQAIFDLYKKQREVTLVQAIGILISFLIDPEEGFLKMRGKERDFFLAWLAGMKIKGGAGRKPRSDTILLLLDAMLLMFYPNAYTHLVRDGLRLRAQDYKLKGRYARLHSDKWEAFRKAQRAVEATSKRIWRTLYGKNSEQALKDWWIRVARQEGLTIHGSEP